METVDIIREIVEGLELTFFVKTITDNGNSTFTLTTNDTLHLQENFPLVIGANSYTIKTVTKDVSIVLSGSVVPNVTSFEVYAPRYYHGTVIKAKGEMENGVNAHNIYDRTPFIYLKEILTDKVNSKFKVTPFEKETSLQLLFLTQSKLHNWKTIDHYEKSIYPMASLVKTFIKSLYDSKYIGRFEDYETINHVNFGVYVTDKGNTKSIFSDQLSGVELNITLPFRKQPLACN
jgi:hypothetical protein